jgi:nucleolar pre-ribosomal-associated protein 1
LLFKVFAAHAEFNTYGSLLCKTLLQPSVARRLVRSLSAPTTKEQVILPALRLLIELTKFNEGAFARSVYARKDFTLEPKILARNIATWKDSKGQTALELQRKPSIRTTSVRYLLAHLKYQDERAKAEIVSNKDVVRAVLDHLTTDPPFLIAEIFDVFTNHIFLDKAIPRHVKSRILNGKALIHIAGLYRYEAPEGSLAENEKTPDVVAHEFLCFVCTSPAYGIMLPTQGFYPHVNEDNDGDALMDDADYIGQDLLDQRPGPVRNLILADFLQSLRPYANTLHQELVTEIFKACPELITNYFYQKQDFNYDPKLTSTWIGFSAFLYQTIEMPVPQFFGASKNYREHPPPISGLLQSIIPQPLTQQVLVKCLNAQSDLISFFAVRVMVVAFQKLQAVLKEFENARVSRPTRSWVNASKRLVSEFSQRCPPMKAVIKAFRQPAFQEGLKREAITRLLKLYYEVTPQIALEEKFDVSVPLCNALTQAEKLPDSAEDKAFCVMELEHWIQMARHTPSMRWWQKNSMCCIPVLEFC